MYQNTTEAFVRAIESDSRTFHARMVYGSEILTGFQSLKIISQANVDTNTISIGGTVSAYAEAVIDRPQAMVAGKEYRLEIGLLAGGEVEWVPMGVFIPQAPKESDGLVTFTAYDRMVSKLSGAYFSDITKYPADGKTILAEIAAKAGIQLGNLEELPAGVMVPMRTQAGESGNVTTKPFDGYTCREAVKYLAQMYGCFAAFNREGRLELRWYTESGLETDRIYQEPEAAEKVYQLQKITCAVGEKVLTAGSGTTGITIENPVMTQTVLDSVYSRRKGMQYLPATASFFGDIRLDLGDIITVYRRDGTPLKIPLMSITQEFDGGVLTSVGSYGNTEEEENLPKGPMATALDRVYTELFLAKEILANKVSADVLEANYATITQLEAVEARIDGITATDITTEYLEAHFAKIDFANVDTAQIRQGFLENLMVSQGIIADRVVGSEVVATDVLTGVKLYANDITAGTLSVERLILRGNEESLVYALNNSGGLESAVVDTLNGDILTDRTVTADKIVAASITSTEIDVKDLVVTGLVGANRITANNINVKDLHALGATIGGFTIGEKAIYNGTNSMASTVSGIYVGTDGIRNYAGNKQYVNIAGGKLTCYGAEIRGNIYLDNQLYFWVTSAMGSNWMNGTALTSSGMYAKALGVKTLNGGIVVPSIPGTLDVSGELYVANESVLITNSTIKVGGTSASGVAPTTVSSAGIKTDGYLTAAGSINGLCIELSAPQPYIDFHFNRSSADYTSRIIEEGSGILNIKGPNSVRVNGNHVASVLTASGTSGIWKYWKWSDGLAICLTINPQGNGVNFPNGQNQKGIFWSAVYGPYAYPFNFVSRPVSLAYVAQYDRTEDYNYDRWITHRVHASNGTPSFYIYGQDGNVQGHPYIHIFVIGRWK